MSQKMQPAAQIISLFILLALISLQGCDVSNPSQYTDQSTLSLRRGDIWIYRTVSSNFEEDIVDTLRVEITEVIEESGNIRYYITRDLYLDYYEIIDQGLRHVTIYMAEPEIDLRLVEEFHWPLEPGEQYSFDSGGLPMTFTCISNSEVVTLPAGTIEGCYKYMAGYRYPDEDEYSYIWVHPSIGVVKRESSSSLFSMYHLEELIACSKIH